LPIGKHHHAVAAERCEGSLRSSPELDDRHASGHCEAADCPPCWRWSDGGVLLNL
jgi:hypothetical protein